MSGNQKFAWFNLAVITVAVIVTFALVPVLGWMRAQGGLGIGGLLGLGVLFFRSRPGQIVQDERDMEIFRRSNAFGFAVVWLTFVLATVGIAPAIYGWEGTIPVPIIQLSVFWAMFVLNVSTSIAILVQYSSGSANAE